MVMVSIQYIHDEIIGLSNIFRNNNESSAVLKDDIIYLDYSLEDFIIIIHETLVSTNNLRRCLIGGGYGQRRS